MGWMTAEDNLLMFSFMCPSILHFILTAVNFTALDQIYICTTNSQIIIVTSYFLHSLNVQSKLFWPLGKSILTLMLMSAGLSVLPEADTFSSVTLTHYTCLLASFALLSPSLMSIGTMRVARFDENQDIDSNFLHYKSAALCAFLVAFEVLPEVLSIIHCDVTWLVIYRNAVILVSTATATVYSNIFSALQLQYAERSLKVRQGFLRYMNHEMRTPINNASIGLYMHERYLEEGGHLDPESKDLLADIRSAISEALDTLNDVLSYEKLRANMMSLERTQVLPGVFIGATLRPLEELANRAGVALSLPSDADMRLMGFLGYSHVPFQDIESGRVSTETHFHCAVSNAIISSGG